MPDVAKLVDGYKGRAKVEAGEAFDPSPANIDKRTEKYNLANGAKVALLNKKTRGETVYGSLVLHLGDEASMFRQKVVFDLSSDMLMRGSEKVYTRRTRYEIGRIEGEDRYHDFWSNLKL